MEAMKASSDGGGEGLLQIKGKVAGGRDIWEGEWEQTDHVRRGKTGEGRAEPRGQG